MSQPILQLQNSANWAYLWGTSVTSIKSPDGRSSIIPPIVVPILLEATIVSIYASSTSAKPSWQIAGNVARKIATGITVPGGAPNTTISDTRLLRLNQINLFRFQRLTETYSLEIRPKWWLNDLAIDLFVYSGIDSDTISEQLDRIETSIERLQ